MNIVEPIHAAAQARPDATALILIDGKPVSFGMLSTLVRRAAGRATELGLQPGMAVAMRIGGGDEALGLIVALGLAHLGVVTCDASLPGRYLSAALVAQGETPPPGVRGLPLDASWLTAPVTLVAPHTGDTALFRVFATSGTTGLPRFCPVSHATMAARVAATGHPIAHTSFAPVVLCALGLDGNWAMRVVLATLSGGGTVVFSNPGQLRRSLVEQRVTSLMTSPAVLQSILEATPPGAPRPPALRSVVAGGSRLPEPLWRRAAMQLCPEIMATFGASETSVVAMGRCEDLAGVPGAVGVLEPGVEAQAVDAAHQPLPPGVEGLIRVRTPGDIAGYLDDAEATASSFRDGWFYTGDIGTLTADRHLVITARAVEIINHGGMKISPRKVEEVLLALPGIREAAAFGVPDRDGVVQVAVAVVAAAPLDRPALDRHCAAQLGPLAPRIVLQVAELPHNANGKVMMQPLIELAGRTAAGGTATPGAA
ncbi:MAG: long-chain fatty acid--CoA ligase [Rhodospirillales bacterium]|nr:long-chain fatty acid--CoA ligase [Rhodospirillales bacterium]